MRTISKKQVWNWQIFKEKLYSFSAYFFSNKFREILFFILLSSILLNLLLITIKIMNFGNQYYWKIWDHQLYISMAEQPFSVNQAPFSRRILVPLIAYILPFRFDVNFFLITHLALTGTAVLIYFILKEMNFRLSLCITGWMLFISMGWITGFLLYDFWLVDSLSFFFIALIIYLILKPKFNTLNWKFIILLAFILILGVLSKEIVIFCLPLIYTLRAKKIFDKKSILETAIISLPCLIAYILLITLIPNTDPGHYLDNFLLFAPLRFEQIQNLNAIIGSFSIGTFGVLVVFIPFFNLKENIPFFKRSFLLILLAYLQLLLAGNTERLLVMCFPVSIILTIYGFKGLSEKFYVPPILSFFLPFSLYLAILITGDYSLPALWQMPILIIGLIFYYNYFSLKNSLRRINIWYKSRKQKNEVESKLLDNSTSEIQ